MKYLNNNCETQIFTDADKAFYCMQKKHLTEAGYSLYAENEIDGNLFSSYIMNGTLVQLYFIPSESTVRMVTDEKTDLYPLTDDYEKKAETVLWQFETDHSLIDCGMCYIIRCADGSFFIIDSAHMYSVNDEKRIYELLRRNTPENERIVISGWFLTHAHDDHVTKFIDFINLYENEVEILNIYCNFPSVEYCKNGDFMESTISVIKRVTEFLTQQKCARLVRVHTGQRFAVRNLIFNVLCTHEDLYPEFFDNFNDTSSVIMMETEGVKVFFPGDAGDTESIILERRFPTYLKSDIVQVAHHGHFGLRPSCYDLINAPLALFPTTEIKYDEEFEKTEANRRAVSLAENYYIASQGTVEIPLECKPLKAKQLPDETNENFEGVYELWGYEYSEQRKAELIKGYEQRKGSQ